MTLEQLEKFNGKPAEFDNYSKLIDKAEKLKKEISRISNQIQDEDLSLSVLEENEKQYAEHFNKKHRLSAKLCKKQTSLYVALADIYSYQK